MSNVPAAPRRVSKFGRLFEVDELEGIGLVEWLRPDHERRPEHAPDRGPSVA
jgi:hypothetical protein